MSNPRYPRVRLTLPKGHSDHLDREAGVEFYLDGSTTVRVALLQRPEHGDWVVQLTGVNGAEISVRPGEGKDFLVG